MSANEELLQSIDALRESFAGLSSEIYEIKKGHAQQKEIENKNIEKSQELERQKLERELSEWQSAQSIWKQHGMKIMTGLFAVVSAGLAWYGSQIRSEIDAEHKAIQVDKSISENRKDIEIFKKQTAEDIHELKRQSINQTIIIDEGFKRVDKIILKAHTKLKEDDLPEVSPEFEEAVGEARESKRYIDRFGELPE